MDNSPYELGKEAYLNSNSFESNPFQKYTTASVEWEKGYMDAESNRWWFGKGE